MDPQTTEAKLQSCIKPLVEAANSWEAGGLIDAPLILAVATPRGAQVIQCGGDFPDVDGVCTREAAAQTVIAAVETPSDTGAHDILCGVTLLIGPEGRATHLENAATIRARNQIPVLLFMIADSATMVATTTAVSRPTRH